MSKYRNIGIWQVDKCDGIVSMQDDQKRNIEFKLWGGPNPKMIIDVFIKCHVNIADNLCMWQFLATMLRILGCFFPF